MNSANFAYPASVLKNSLGVRSGPKLKTEHSDFGTFRARFGVVLGSMPTFSTGCRVLRCSLPEVATWHTKIVHMGDASSSFEGVG